MTEELKKMAEQAAAKDPKDRTYTDRFYIWYYEQETNPDMPYNEGEEVEIYDGVALANNELKDGFGNEFPDYIRCYGNLFNTKVKYSGSEYILRGISHTYTDYYFILEKDGELYYGTCIHGLC